MTARLSFAAIRARSVLKKPELKAARMARVTASSEGKKKATRRVGKMARRRTNKAMKEPEITDTEVISRLTAILTKKRRSSFQRIVRWSRLPAKQVRRALDTGPFIRRKFSGYSRYGLAIEGSPASNE